MFPWFPRKNIRHSCTWFQCTRENEYHISSYEKRRGWIRYVVSMFSWPKIREKSIKKVKKVIGIHWIQSPANSPLLCSLERTQDAVSRTPYLRLMKKNWAAAHSKMYHINISKGANYINRPETNRVPWEHSTAQIKLANDHRTNRNCAGWVGRCEWLRGRTVTRRGDRQVLEKRDGILGAFPLQMALDLNDHSFSDVFHRFANLFPATFPLLILVSSQHNG